MIIRVYRIWFLCEGAWGFLPAVYACVGVDIYFKGCLYIFSDFLNFKNHFFNYHLKQQSIKIYVSALFIKIVCSYSFRNIVPLTIIFSAAL